MDEYSAKQTLKRLYKVENRSVKLEVEALYVTKHIERILAKNNGVWSNEVATNYIQRLEQSI